MDLIEVLPPGLYEMILEEKKTDYEDVGADFLPGDAAQPAVPADVPEDDADRGSLVARPRNSGTPVPTGGSTS